MKTTLFTCIVGCGMLHAGQEPASPAPPPPNILLAVADDWGLYADAKRRDFHERHMSGEKIPTNWVNPGDFEKSPPEP